MKFFSFLFFLTLSFSIVAQNWTIGSKISICKGEQITITSPVNNASSYSWSTGDFTQSVTVSPTSTTLYSVTVLNNGNQIVDTSIVYVFTVDAGQNDTICIGDSARFSASGGQMYVWYPTEGLLNTTGPYNAVKTDTNVTYYCDITSIGPNNIYNGDFELGNLGFISDYLYNNNLWVAATYAVGFFPSDHHANFSQCPDHTSGSGKQMIVNGAPTPNTTVWKQTIEIVPNTDYIFSSWVQNVGPDANLAQLQFRINSNLIGPVFESSSVICQWSNFYTLWNSGSNSIAEISIVNQNVGGSGNDFALDDIYFAEVKVCTDSVQIIVDDTQMSLGNDTTICEGQYFFLQTDGVFDSYYWSTGSTAPSIMVLVQDQYTVTCTTPYHCELTDTVNVYFKPQPRLELTTSKNPICEGENVQIFVESSSTPIFLFWDNGDFGDTINVKPLETTFFTVIGNKDDCVDTADIEIEVIPHQTIDLGVDDFLCSGQSVFLNLDSLNGNFLWSTDETTNQILIEEAGVYSVFIDDRGCTLTDTIKFEECSEIKIPNIFTPNGDLINDYFYPETEGIDTLIIWIYDRWGKRVFITEDFKTGWDGKINGQLAPDGQYYWVIYYIENKSGNIRKEKELHGSLILAR